MKFKLFFLAVITIIMASCTSNEILDLDKDNLKVTQEQQMLHITASFEESSETRATLEEIGSTLVKNIRYKWQVTDKIQFSFVQGTNTITDETTVSGVSLDGRTAEFTITIPSVIDKAQPYKLYAYRTGKKGTIPGGSGLIPNTTTAVLPTQQYDYKATLADQAIIFSIWSEKDVPANSSANIALSFKHFGSMMTLNVKNTGGTSITDLHSFVLQETTVVNWIYNRFNGGGGAEFDLSTGTFVDGEEQYSYTLTFIALSQTINAGEVGTYYLWFVPNPAITSITLGLASMKPGGTDISGISDPHKTITTSLVPGKNYVLFAHISAGAVPPYSYKIEYKTSATF